MPTLSSLFRVARAAADGAIGAVLFELVMRKVEDCRERERCQSAQSTACQDCSEAGFPNVPGTGYVLHPDVWNDAIRQRPATHLCAACVSERLGRDLTQNDLAEAIENHAALTGLALSGLMSFSKLRFWLRSLAAPAIEDDSGDER